MNDSLDFSLGKGKYLYRSLWHAGIWGGKFCPIHFGSEGYSGSKYLKNPPKNNSDTNFFAYKIKTHYFMTKQVVWIFRKLFFLMFDTKFVSKQPRLAKIETILWLLLSTQI